MKLSETFTQLPLVCDVERLRHELSLIGESEWRAHPSQYKGNSAALLITVNGEANDDLGHEGQFRPTPLLGRLPYTRQVMRSLAAPLSRSRFMRVAPRSSVPPHDDVGWHWFRRVRVHVPIVTDPRVVFHCAGKQVHMAAGEAWIFDNFEQHSVSNGSDIFRIHLVVDVVPSSAFFALVARGRHPYGTANPDFNPTLVPSSDADDDLPIEPHVLAGLTKEELAAMVRDIGNDIPRFPAGRRRTAAEAQLRAFEASVLRDNDYEACRTAAKKLCNVLLPAYRDSALEKTPGLDMVRVLCTLGFAQDAPSAFSRILRWTSERLGASPQRSLQSMPPRD